MIRERGKEHARCMKNLQFGRSAVAAHCWEEKRSIDFKPVLLKEVRRRNELNVWESIHIYKNLENCYNLDVGGTVNTLFKAMDKVKPENGRKERSRKTQTIAAVASHH